MQYFCFLLNLEMTVFRLIFIFQSSRIEDVFRLEIAYYWQLGQLIKFEPESYACTPQHCISVFIFTARDLEINILMLMQRYPWKHNPRHLSLKCVGVTCKILPQLSKTILLGNSSLTIFWSLRQWENLLFWYHHIYRRRFPWQQPLIPVYRLLHRQYSSTIHLTGYCCAHWPQFLEIL